MDTIKLSGPAIPTDEIEVTYTYIKPIKMIVTESREHQNFKPIGEYIEGDAQFTFMPWFHIGNRDKLTLLDPSVNTRTTELLKKDVNERLKSDELLEILEVRKDEEVYVRDVDYKIVDVNIIEWISGGNAPDYGEYYSVTYTARREYVIWGEIWQDRHHGQVLLPRRVNARRMERYNFVRDNSYGVN